MSKEKDNKSPKHLHGALYLVRFEDLIVPESKEDETEEYQFYNPRTLTEKGTSDLFDKRKSQEIRDSIKNKTLMNPFICRWVKINGKLVPQVVGGDRRYRALDYLIRKKELVKDPNSSKLDESGDYEYEWRTADKVYESVLCQIYSATNDLDALALSYAENQCRENFGEGHDVATVMELRKYKATDEKIMTILSKDERWLKQTDNLIANLDAETLKELLEDRITREAAVELASIVDNNLRSKVREAANEESEKVAEQQVEEMRQKVLEAVDQEEIAKGSVVVAEMTGDEEEIKSAKEELKVAGEKIDVAVKQKEKIKPVTTKQQVQKKLRGIANGEGPRPAPKSPCLKSNAIKKNFIEPLIDLIKTGCEIERDVIVDEGAVRLSLRLIQAITEGKTECLEMIKKHVLQEDEIASEYADDKGSNSE